MKAMKKILALVLGIVMALALSVTAFAAADTQHTITITNADPAKQHTYEAYQVLAGVVETVDGKQQLTKITWGAGVNGEALLTALKADATLGASFAGATNAVDVARILAGFGDDSTALDAFALLVGQNLKAGSVAGTSTETKSPYTINVVGDGYYFVKDKDGTVPANQGESYSKYMLKVITDASIEAKDDHLVPEKKIIEGEEKLDANSAAIGDVITYEITIPIPEMDGYKNYFFQMVDTMCKGLTFKEIVSVKVGDTTLVEKTPESPATSYIPSTTTAANGETTLKIEFNNFIQYKGTTGNVVVRYTAILNENAELIKSNDNTVHYVYSNNPSNSGDGNWRENVGETPKDTVKTYVTELKVIKIGDGNEATKLAGAQFQLTGDALNTVLVDGIKFEKAPYTAVENETVETGDYYLLKDGTYTATAPTDLTKDQYQSTTDKYVKVTYTNKKIVTSETVKAIVTTDANGLAVFTGLKPGQYTLTELVAPTGYNKVAPITFTIEWDETNGFKVKSGDTSGVTYDAANHQFTITVDNKSGSTLPSTGGIGTTIFYALGAVLAISAGVVLVTKRRVGDEH